MNKRITLHVLETSGTQEMVVVRSTQLCPVLSTDEENIMPGSLLWFYRDEEVSCFDDILRPEKKQIITKQPGATIQNLLSDLYKQRPVGNVLCVVISDESSDLSAILSSLADTFPMVTYGTIGLEGVIPQEEVVDVDAE
jgi:hypothetical protein